MPTDLSHFQHSQEDAIRAQITGIRMQIEQSVSQLINTRMSDQTAQIARATIDNNMRMLVAYGQVSDYHIVPVGSDPNYIELDMRLTGSLRIVKMEMTINTAGPERVPDAEPITKMSFIVGENL